MMNPQLARLDVEDMAFRPRWIIHIIIKTFVFTLENKNSVK